MYAIRSYYDSLVGNQVRFLDEIDCTPEGFRGFGEVTDDHAAIHDHTGLADIFDSAQVVLTSGLLVHGAKHDVTAALYAHSHMAAARLPDPSQDMRLHMRGAGLTRPSYNFV